MKYSTEKQSVSIIKVLTVGECGVGKSSLLSKFANDEPFDPHKTTTLAIDFFVKTIFFKPPTSNSVEIRLQLWDTAGQERYRSILPLFYRSADAIFIVYDVTEQNVFKNLCYWMTQSIAHCGEDCIIIILENKCDLPCKNKVTHEQLTEFLAQNYPTRQNNMSVFHVSAKTGQGIDQAFKFLIEKIVSLKIDKNHPSNETNYQISRKRILFSSSPETKTLENCSC